MTGGARAVSMRALLSARPELLVVAALLLTTAVAAAVTSDSGIGRGVVGLGLVEGASLATQAIGLVLVYRSNRIINFAHVQVGAVGGVLFYQLVQSRVLLLAVDVVCPGCVGVVRIETPERSYSYARDVTPWLLQANFWISMVLALVLVAALAYGGYALVVRRFANAPRLVTTVVTIALAEVFVLIADLLPGMFPGDDRIAGTARFPVDIGFSASGVVFGTAEILTVALAVATVVGVTLLLTRTDVGVVLRGASENPQRAETLGVNLPAVTSVVWVIAGLLSGAGAVLAATSVGVGGVAGEPRLLAVAVVGGLVSVPMTVVGGIGFGVANQLVLTTLNAPHLLDGMALVVIVAALLLQRARTTRVDTDAEAGWKAAREVRPIPAELRELDVVQRWLRAARVVGVVCIVGLPWLLSPAQTNLAVVALCYGIVAMSLLVLTGWAGQISLGHFGFAAIGAWTTAVTGWPFPLSILAGGALGTIAAVVVGVPALRLRGLHLAVTTLAFAVAVSSVLLSPRSLGRLLPSTLERPSVVGLSLEDDRTFYYFVLAVLVAVVLAVVGIRRSRAARALIAARDNEAAAQSFGVDLVRTRLAAFAFSGFLAAIAGGMFAYSQYGVNATSFTRSASVRVFLMAIIGGLGSITGPLVGAGFLGIVNIFGQTEPIVAAAATGLGVLILLLALPAGLGDLVFRIRDALLRRVAERYRIEVPTLAGATAVGTRPRLPIEAKRRPGGGTAFTPVRYRPRGQWSIEGRSRARRRDEADV